MGISIPQLLIILLITALLFGTKKLKNIGTDLGAALKGFKKAMREDDPEDEPRLQSRTGGESRESASTRKDEEQV